MTENGQSYKEHDARIGRNEDDIQDIRKTISDIQKMLQYRLPLWSVFLISGLTGLCGWLIHYASVAAQLAEKIK